MSVYLEHNAPARVRPEAIAAMTAVMQAVGNPSSIHAAGRSARAVMEQARADVAALIAAPASTVVFFSGGTEANVIPGECEVELMFRLVGDVDIVKAALEHWVGWRGGALYERCRGGGGQVAVGVWQSHGVAAGPTGAGVGHGRRG